MHFFYFLVFVVVSSWSVLFGYLILPFLVLYRLILSYMFLSCASWSVLFSYLILPYLALSYSSLSHLMSPWSSWPFWRWVLVGSGVGLGAYLGHFWEPLVAFFAFGCLCCLCCLGCLLLPLQSLPGPLWDG